MALNIVTEIDNRVQIKNVLMSVSDKTGLETFVPALVKACPGVKIYSPGGTYTKVKEILGPAAEGTLVAVSDYTGQPEMQGGLVKTLDFKIYLGLLSETYKEGRLLHRHRQGRAGHVDPHVQELRGRGWLHP